MKICITSTGNNLESKVDERFGRCGYFIFVDPETLEFEAVENEYRDGYGGVGVKAGELVAEKDADGVLTGKVGPNAFRTLESAGIKVYTGASGTVKETIEKYKKGDFDNAERPTENRKSGLN